MVLADGVGGGLRTQPDIADDLDTLAAGQDVGSPPGAVRGYVVTLLALGDGED